MPQCPNPHRSERCLLPWFGATAQFVGRLTTQAVISLGANGRYDLDANILPLTDGADFGLLKHFSPIDRNFPMDAPQFHCQHVAYWHF
jgi:hypothetical protein